MPSDNVQRAYARRSSLWTAFLIGVGIMAALDEIVFHQLLRWHHFFDRSTPAVGLISDGLLHAGELIAVVAGFFMLADLRRRGALASRWAISGLFLGMGAFQVFDGIIDHKVLRVHQIRYGTNLLPYDLGWNTFGLVLILIGIWLLYRARAAAVTRTSN